MVDQVSYDVVEARSLLKDYRDAIGRCRNGALLKIELARLNLRAFDLGLSLTPDTVLAQKFQEVVCKTSNRLEQGGIYAHSQEAQNIQQWIDFLAETVSPSPALLAFVPRGKCGPLL